MKHLHVHWVTNIPTPYRNHLHRAMAEIFPRHDLSFEVLYMAWTAHTRHWTFRPQDLPYPHRVFGGIQPVVRDVDIHVNPGLLRALAREPADIAVVGGWASPSHLLAPFASRAALRLLYTEGNLQSVRRLDGPGGWLKRRLVRRYHGFIVPQERTVDMLRTLDPAAAAKPVIRLPNLVDESIWSGGVKAAAATRAATRRRRGVDDDTPLWVCLARLESFKGLDRFLPRLAGRRGFKLVIAGDGSQRAELQRIIDTHHLPVELLGQRGQDEVVELYAGADLLVLPSMSDPSPLTVIEASAAGLPLLVSNRIGNHDDVLVAGVNGWSFDPTAPSSDFLDQVLATSPAALREMGRASERLYHERFGTTACVERLASGLRDAFARKAAA